MITRGSQAHTFDRANRMLTANTGSGMETYKYNGHGRRTTIIRSGQLGQTTQLYTRGGQLIYERAPSGTVTKHIHLGNRLVASVTSSTVSQHTDTLGSIVKRTNLIRGVVGTTVYESYGSLGTADPYEQRPGFTGHMTDAATTLSYMQQRYYDPIAMRFLSVGPVAASTTDGSNFNRYWYANNNPYKFTDPDGRFGEGAAERFSDAFASDPQSFEAFGSVAAVATGAMLAGPIGARMLSTALANPVTPTNTVNTAVEVGAGIATGAAIPSSAIVARGGGAANQTAEKINGAIGPSRTPGVVGFSAQCDGGTCVATLGSALRNKELGVTTAGAISAAGGDVVPTPGPGNHVTVTGLSGESAAPLMKIVDNPNLAK